MKKAGRRFHRIFRAVFAAALALAITGANLAPAAAVTWADVNELKDEANGLDAEKKELQAKLDALADDKSQAVARKELLDQQIANTEAQIANTQAQIDRYAALITQTEAELVEAEEKEAAQYELFCSRVREMEKQDEVSYWAVLFRASSFTDLLGRLDAINEIMKYDQGVIDDLKALQAEIEEKKATLESSKAETEAAKAELVSKENELNTQRSQANAVIQQLSANENETEAALADLEAEQDGGPAPQRPAGGPAGRQRPVHRVQSRRLHLAGEQPVHHFHGRRPGISRRYRLHQPQGYGHRPGGLHQLYLRRQVRHGYRVPVQ